MGRLEAPAMRRIAPAGGGFSTTREACGRLIVARADSGRNAAGTAIYVLFIPSFSGNIESSNQNNAGPVANGATREKLNVPT